MPNYYDKQTRSCTNTHMQVHITDKMLICICVFCTPFLRSPVDQWVKRWPTDLAVPGSSPTRGIIFSAVNGVLLHTAFHYHPLIVMILLKTVEIENDVKSQVIHPPCTPIFFWLLPFYTVFFFFFFFCLFVFLYIRQNNNKAYQWKVQKNSVRYPNRTNFKHPKKRSIRENIKLT